MPVAFIFLLLASQAQAALAFHAAPPQQQGSTHSRIVTASGVRLRERPDTGAGEVARLQLGVVVEESEHSPDKVKIGALEDYWYLVSAPGGARGWVFGGLTAPFDSEHRDLIYNRLAQDRLANTAATFAELSDLVLFLDRATKEVTRRDALAELELSRLVALARSLASIPMENLEKTPYKEWTTGHEKEIVYSEPAGQWFVRADLFWNLERKYRGLPLAERAAWQAAETPLPGECEGYLPCSLSLETWTNGKYLKLYPRGPHAAKALANISEFIEGVTQDQSTDNPTYSWAGDDEAELQKLLATLREQITLVASPKKPRLLKQLDALARPSPVKHRQT
ncbi:MAG: hypothetical protein QOC99_1880 [Acidobacteriota bacterium]|nr:hypothetical protein [Acidobacteriota bacterium]